MPQVGYSARTMKIVTGILLALVAMGCGDDQATGDLDAGPPADARPPCQVITNEYCDPDQKCTWIHESTDVWTVDCFTDGTEALGMPCQWGVNGTSTGADNCSSGLLCVDNTCREVCTLAPDSCAAPETCVRAPQSMGDAAEYGVCLAP